MNRREFLLAAPLGAAAAAGQGADARVVRHVTVAREAGRFGGWPANNGIWHWGEEIVVGFKWGYFKRVERGHAIDGARESPLRYARSRDGGQTWSVEVPSYDDSGDVRKEDFPECPGGLDFTRPDAAVALRMVSSRGGGYSRFYYSPDRCRAWQGPYRLPRFGRKGIAARTDYLVNGKHDLMAFVTASKEDSREGRVFVTRTRDGGKTWDFVSWIGPEPPGFAIMPSSVRVSPKKILTTIRCKEGERHWIEAWISEDDGQTWRFLNKPAESTGGSVGNPPSMIMLKDGRLAITYGYRSAPYGMRARLSADDGQSWGPEIRLRDDGGCWDLGYPRTVQRPDGNIVTVYYFNDHPDRERYIAATIWDPGPGKGRGFERA